MQRLRHVHFALSVLGLLGAATVSQAAHLTPTSATRAVNECIKGNGAVTVKGVHVNETEGDADVEIRGYKIFDANGKVHLSNIQAKAHFIAYNNEIHDLRTLTATDGTMLSCHVDVTDDE